MVKLGSRVKDTITGFAGIATARSDYLNGCISICVAAEELNKDGEPKIEWFDEQRVAVLLDGAFAPEPTGATAGGPQARPPRDGAR